MVGGIEIQHPLEVKKWGRDLEAYVDGPMGPIILSSLFNPADREAFKELNSKDTIDALIVKIDRLATARRAALEQSVKITDDIVDACKRKRPTRRRPVIAESSEDDGCE